MAGLHSSQQLESHQPPRRNSLLTRVPRVNLKRLCFKPNFAQFLAYRIERASIALGCGHVN